MEGFGITTMKKVNYIKEDVALIPENFHQLKKNVSGFYGGKDGRSGFNNEVLRNYLSELTGNWGKVYNSTAYFPSFEIFYYKFMKGKEDHIERVIEKILTENKGYPGISRYMVYASFIVRMGNTYNGTNAEERIINTINNLKDYISCTKVPDEIDQKLKVDAVIEFTAVDSFAVQIKPVSNQAYDEGSELEYHQKYTDMTGQKVFYLYYTNDNKIILQDEQVDLADELSLISLLQNIVYSL
jgi:hypothetical protein